MTAEFKTILKSKTNKIIDSNGGVEGMKKLSYPTNYIFEIIASDSQVLAYCEDENIDIEDIDVDDILSDMGIGW